MIIDESFEDLVKTQSREMGRELCWSSTGFEGLRIATTSALLQTFEILSWRKQEERKSRSQDFKPGPAWIKSSEQIESGPGALPGFKW